MASETSTVRKPGSIAALGGFLATSVAVIALPLILIAVENRSPYFWHRIAWAEFLAIIVWASMGGYLSAITRRGVGGALPATGIILYSFVALSFLFMIAHAWIPANDSSDMLDRVHVAVQVLGLVVTILIVLGMYFVTASAGAAIAQPSGFVSPPRLASLLSNAREMLDRNNAATKPLMTALTALEEKISYSLQETGSITQSSEYEAFARDVAALCGEVKGAAGSGTIDGSLFQRLAATAGTLKGQVGLIADSLKRR